MNPQLDPKRLPQHIAIIMDGNGRWARGRNRSRIFGHREGSNSVREIVSCCRSLGIPYLTLYAFSKENWQRPDREVKALWQLLKRFLRSQLPEIIEKEIRLCHLGDLEGIPEGVVEELQAAVAETSRYDKLTLSLAINYGGRQEIARAARLFAADVQQGKCDLHEFTAERLSQYLFTAELPDPDLMIRTGGEYRVSNFLLWQLAYAELYITKVLWPDFRESHFIEALCEYQRRERRFGKTSEQIRQARFRTGKAKLL
jgi:undecaprenyl diphosphate synthase